MLLIECEGEGECKGEMVAGQFSIFGAIEENLRHGFSPIFTDQEGASIAVANGRDRETFRLCAARHEEFGKVGSRVVHRACTGNAEMRVGRSSKFSDGLVA